MNKVAKREQASMMVSLSERWGIESDQLIPVTKATIFKADAGKVSDGELIAFLMVCDRYDLNPFMRQIHAYYDSRRSSVVPIVGVDGWVDLVGREKRFEGMEFQEFSDETSGKLLAYLCRIYIQGMRVPIEVTERLTECYRNTEPWNKMPHRMLRHKSLIQAARYAFGFSGIFDEDEGRDIVAGSVEPFTEPKSLQEARQAPDPPTDPQVAAPPPVEEEAPPQVRPGCPGCQVERMAHLEACPNRPKATTEEPASEMLKGQVTQLVEKLGLGPFKTDDLTALEARMILSKRNNTTLKPVLDNIEKARTGMI